MKTLLLIIALFFSLAACTTKPAVKSKTKASKKYNVQKSVHPSRGFLIEGKDNENAINHLFDQIIDLTEDEIALTNDGKNPPYYNRLLKIVIDENATVGQVNQALRKAGTLISFSEEKDPQVTVLIPPPGGLENLKKFRSLLAKSNFFATVEFETP